MSSPQNHQPTPSDDGTPANPGTPARGHYGEISPGVPRYGQYAPEGWQPPSSAPGTPEAGNVPAAPGSPTGRQAPAPASPAKDGGVQPPRQVQLAVRFIRYAGIISALTAVLSAVAMFNPTVILETERQLESMGFTDMSMIRPALVASIVLTAIGVLIYFWLAAAIRKGRNWARITATVMAAVSLLSLLVPNPIAIVQVLLGAIAVLMLWRSPAKGYFKR
jgi:hypothetical protein